MFCKQFFALFLWCHCYQIILNPLIQMLAYGINNFSSASSDGDTLHYPGYYVSGTPLTAAANKVTLTPGQEIALRCNVDGFPDATFTWYMQRVFPHNQTTESEKVKLAVDDQRYSISKNVMIIKSSTLADVGDYFCRVEDKLDSEVDEPEKKISVRPKPFIQEFDLQSSTYKSAIVEEGQPLKISCNVFDEYFKSDSINMSWQVSKYDENDMNDIQSGEDDIELESNSRTSLDLKIGKVTKDHRRLYKCRASNGVTENSKTILIRVKNKYTVIWPAVGIFIEFVILIGVIIVVENRRVEPDKGAYDRKAIHQM